MKIMHRHTLVIGLPVCAVLMISGCASTSTTNSMTQQQVQKSAAAPDDVQASFSDNVLTSAAAGVEPTVAKATAVKATSACDWQSPQALASVPAGYRTFDTNENAIAWAQDWYGDEPTGVIVTGDPRPDGFTKSTGASKQAPQDSESYLEYRAVSDYTGDYYKQLNRAAGDPAYLSSASDYLRQDMQALSNIFAPHDLPDGSPVKNRLPEGVTLFRGEDRTAFDSLGITNPEQMKGKTVTAKRFVSTSVGTGPTDTYGKRAVQYRIFAPAGTPVLNVMDVSWYPTEREIMLENDLDYTFTNSYKAGNTWCMDVQVAPNLGKH